jgi:hypothetical protein
MHVSYFAIQVYFEYKGNANESMELSQLTFDAVRGRVDTEEGWGRCRVKLHYVIGDGFTQVILILIFSQAP